MIQQFQRSKIPQTPIITVRPSPRMVRFFYLAAACMAAIIAVATIFLIAFMPFYLAIIECLYVTVGGSLAIVAPLYYKYVKLRSSIYTVMDEYVAVEADMGIFGRSSQHIPIAYIRDVSAKFLPLQPFRNIGKVTVKATNGDYITIEYIENAESVRDTIWQMVQAAASRY